MLKYRIVDDLNTKQRVFKVEGLKATTGLN